MPSPIITVWAGNQLISATTLPQFNAVSGARTKSLQITNDSDLGLIYHAEKGVDIPVQPRYQLSISIPPNNQYQLSLAPGQTGTTKTGQTVTVMESDLDSSYSSQPLASNVQVVNTVETNSAITNTVSAAITGTVQTQVNNVVSAAITNTVQAEIASIVQAQIANIVQTQVGNTVNTKAILVPPSLVQFGVYPPNGVLSQTTTPEVTLPAPLTKGNIVVVVLATYRPTLNFYSIAPSMQLIAFTGNTNPKMWQFGYVAVGGEQAFWATMDYDYYTMIVAEYTGFGLYSMAASGATNSTASIFDFPSLSVSPANVPYLMVYGVALNSQNAAVNSLPLSLKLRAYAYNDITLALFDGLFTSSAAFSPLGSWNKNGTQSAVELQIV